MPVGTTAFPTALDTATELIRVVNAASNTIGVGGVTNVATTVPVTSTTAAPADGVAWCGTEAISYTGKTGTTLTGCVRGFDGTTAASHNAGDLIYFAPLIAAHHRVLTDAIIAIETLLGVAGVNVKVGGATTQVQFNDGGVLGGDAGMTYDKTTDILTVGDARVATAGTNAASMVTVGGVQTLTGKTLTAPVIGDLSAATHTHLNAAGGGQVSLDALSDVSTFVKAILFGQGAYNPPSLATGVSATTTVTVAGAAVGDACFAGHALLVTGWTITCVISAADTAEIRITNNTGGTVDLGSANARVVCFDVT
jgi:hypothetical protein